MKERLLDWAEMVLCGITVGGILLTFLVGFPLLWFTGGQTRPSLHTYPATQEQRADMHPSTTDLVVEEDPKSLVID